MAKTASSWLAGLSAGALVAVAPVVTHGADGGRTAQITKGPYLQELGPSSVTVRTELAGPEVAVIVATPVDSKGLAVTARAEARAFHSIRLDGLSPATRYAYVETVGGSNVGGTFTTASQKDSPSTFSFLIYGDDRTDHVTHAAVARALQSVASDFLLNTGDFVEDGSNPSDWQTFFDIEGPLLRDRCVVACVGNHELLEAQGTSFLRYFGPSQRPWEDGSDVLPRLYDSVRWGNTRFFLLNGMDTFSSSGEKEWLEDELRKADHEPGLTWRIVVVHHGPWSSGPHGPNRRLHDAGIPAMWKAHGVDLVVSGHDHIFERGEESGLRYLVSGGGGAPLYRNVSPLPSTIKVEPTYHFVEVSVGAATVNLVAKRLDGSILDRSCFGHSPGWDCNPRGKAAEIPASTAAPGPSAAPPLATASKCSCHEVGATPNGSPECAAVLGLVLVGLRRARRASRRLI